MPTKKTKKTAKTSRTRVSSAISRKSTPKSNDLVSSEIQKETAVSRSLKLNRRAVVFLILIGLVLLIYYKKSWFVAATVNGQPISNIELAQRMYGLYKGDTVKQLVNEKILEQAAAKSGVFVQDAEVNQKLQDDITKKYGGQDSLNSAIAQQGADKNSVLGQLRTTAKIELLVEGLYGKEASPTATQIDQYMKDNANLPEASDAAKFKALATDAVKQDNLNKLLSSKFQALKQAAKIQIF